MLLLEVFSEVLLPLVLLASLGALVGLRVGVPVVPLSNLVYNLFTPALVFYTLVDVELDARLVPRIVMVVALGFLVSAVVGVGWAAFRGQPRPWATATALSLAVINLGNMGLPVARLAFGEAGLGVAVVAFVTGSVLNNSFGIVIASLSETRLRTAFRAMLSVPALWAVLPALAVRGSGVSLPGWFAESVGLLAQAAIPVMLVVLGLQAANRVERSELTSVAVPSVLRLLLGPAVAWGATVLFGLDGVAQRTLIVLGGMPTAVIATIIATRHGAAPERVARMVVVSTIASFLSLTTLIALLR